MIPASLRLRLRHSALYLLFLVSLVLAILRTVVLLVPLMQADTAADAQASRLSSVVATAKMNASAEVAGQCQVEQAWTKAIVAQQQSQRARLAMYEKLLSFFALLTLLLIGCSIYSDKQDAGLLGAGWSSLIFAVLFCLTYWPAISALLWGSWQLVAVLLTGGSYLGAKVAVVLLGLGGALFYDLGRLRRVMGPAAGQLQRPAHVGQAEASGRHRGDGSYTRLS